MSLVSALFLSLSLSLSLSFFVYISPSLAYSPKKKPQKHTRTFIDGVLICNAKDVPFFRMMLYVLIEKLATYYTKP